MPVDSISLIETLLWEPGAGYWLLERHLVRLERSARYFDIPLAVSEVGHLLDTTASGFDGNRMRVRLLLDQKGEASVTATALPPVDAGRVFRFVIAEERVDSGNVYLQHKTTHRDFLDAPRMRAVERLGVDEVIFTNERGEVTEGSYLTLFVERDGALLTPALASGLLPGTLRAELLAEGRAREAVLYPHDLDQADAIWLGNSVRGLIRAERQMPGQAGR